MEQKVCTSVTADGFLITLDKNKLWLKYGSILWPSTQKISTLNP